MKINRCICKKHAHSSFDLIVQLRASASTEVLHGLFHIGLYMHYKLRRKLKLWESLWTVTCYR